MEAAVSNIKISALGYYPPDRPKVELVSLRKRGTIVQGNPSDVLFMFSLYPRLTVNELSSADHAILAKMERRTGHLADIVLTGLPRKNAGQHLMFLVEDETGYQLLMRYSRVHYSGDEMHVTLAMLPLSKIEGDALKHMSGLD